MARSAFNILKNAGRYLMLARSIPDMNVSQITPEACRKNPDLWALAIICLLNAEAVGASALWIRELRARLQGINKWNESK